MAYADERAALAAVTADGYKLGDAGGGRKRPRRGGVGGRKNAVTSGPQDAPMRPTTSSFRRFSGIGILILDAPPPPRVVAAALAMSMITHSQRIPSAAYRPLRTSQWALLERAQRAENVVALVICCDRPLIPEPNSWAKCDGASIEALDSTIAASEATRTYETHPEVLRLLDTLFEWLSYHVGKSQRRSVQLLCGISPRLFTCNWPGYGKIGGCRWSFRTKVRDIVSGCIFEQLCIGALPAQGDVRLLHLGAPPFTIIDRYEFVHSLTGTVEVPIENGTLPIAVLSELTASSCFVSTHDVIPIHACILTLLLFLGFCVTASPSRKYCCRIIRCRNSVCRSIRIASCK